MYFYLIQLEISIAAGNNFKFSLHAGNFQASRKNLKLFINFIIQTVY
jgi:hypothetical protein